MLRRTILSGLILAVGAGLLAGCGGDGDGDATDGEVVTTTTADGAAEDRFRLLSEAFEEGQAIPERFAGRDGNVSPPLVWRFPPEDRVEFVVIVDDPDAPRDEPFVHWLVAGIPDDALGIPEGSAPEGAVEGLNGLGEPGWFGPAPPAGEVHTYRFTIHALASPSELEAGFDRAQLEAAIDGKIIETATFTARYPGDDAG